MGTGDGSVGNSTQIVNNGPVSRLFNMVVLGDGYRQPELAQFATDTKTFVTAMRETAPFCHVWDAFNVFRIDVSSTDSGADDPRTCGDGSVGSGRSARTYFDATFCSSNNRRLLTVKSSLVMSTAAAKVPEYDLAVVIVNDAQYGGSGGPVATLSSNAGSIPIAVHEIGHTAFGLADEYEYLIGCGSESDRDNHPGVEPSAANATTRPFFGQLKWGGYVLDGTALPTTRNANCSVCDPQPSPLPAGRVGAFEGADSYHCGAWRPEFTCRMRHQLSEFCHVCSGEIVRKMSWYRPFAMRFAWKGVGNDWNIYIGEGKDRDQTKLNDFGTGNSPALASYDGTSMVWRGAANDQRIWYSNLNSIDGVTWSRQREVPQAWTSTGPALATFNGDLYMAWKGAGNDQSLWFNRRNVTGWSSPSPIPNGGTSSQPALCAFNNRLVAVWKGISGDQGMYYSTFDGNTWQAQRSIPGVGTTHYPGLASYRGRLYMAWKGAGDDFGVYYATFDGTTWSGQRPIPGAGSTNAPSLAAGGNSLFMTWVGAPGDLSLYYTVFDGAQWSPRRNYFGVGSSAGPAVLTRPR